MSDLFSRISRRGFLKYPLAASTLVLLERRSSAWNLLPGDQRPSADEHTELLIRNARVYTVEKDRPWAEAIAIKGDRIIWVGSNSDASRQVSTSARVIDAGGRLVLPGFIDCHNHIDSGSNPDLLRIAGTASLSEIQKSVKDFAAAHPDLKWIEATGWNYSVFGPGVLPTTRDLEGLTGGRPAFLVAYDGHTAWANKEALREFGITKRTKSPAVQMDPKTGEPTGILIGLSSGIAAEFLSRMPGQTKAEESRGLQASFAMAVGFGITTLIEPQCTVARLHASYDDARKRGDLQAWRCCHWACPAKRAARVCRTNNTSALARP